MRRADAARPRRPGRPRRGSRPRRVAAAVAALLGLGALTACSAPLDDDDLAEAFADLPGVDGQRADCDRNKFGFTCSAVVWMSPSADPDEVGAVVARARDLSGTATLRLWLGEPDQRAPRPTTAGRPLTAVPVAGVSATIALRVAPPEGDAALGELLAWAATTPDVAGLSANVGAGARGVGVTVREVDDDPAGSAFWDVAGAAVELAVDVVPEEGELVVADGRHLLTVPGGTDPAGAPDLARTVDAAVPLGLVKVAPGYVGLGVTDPADLPRATALAEVHPAYAGLATVQVTDVATLSAVTGSDPDLLSPLAPLVEEARGLPGVDDASGTGAGLLLRGASPGEAEAALALLARSQPAALDAVPVTLGWPGGEVHLLAGDRTMVATAVAVADDPAVRSIVVRPGTGAGDQARAGEVRVSGADHVAVTEAVGRAVAAERPGVPLRVHVGVDVPGTAASVWFDLTADPGPEVDVQGTENRELRREISTAWRVGVGG